MDDKNKVEQVVLLGLVTVLGATVTLYAALAALVVSAAAAIVVCAVGPFLKSSETMTPPVRWTVLLAVGFSVSWILGSLAPWLLPIPERAHLFIRISGLMPVVFHAEASRAAETPDWKSDALLSWIIFGVLLVLTGLVREFFGRGTIAGYLVFTGWTIPADFFSSPVGAFLVPATVILLARIFAGVLQTRRQRGAS